MSWYQSLSWLEIIFGTLFLLLYGGYIYRIKRLAAYFKQNANDIWLKFILRSVYFFLLLIALLGPSFGSMKKEIRTTGKDIFVLVDLSASMNVPDIGPSRLEQVKYELNQFIPAANADRIGLIGFSSEAFVHCPLTYDQDALGLYNRLLNSNLAPAGGANFKPALQLALTKLEENKTTTNQLGKAQLIVLFSDGEDFSPDIRSLLQRLYNLQVRVFTVGVGSKQGGTIPVGKSFKKDASGEKVISALKPASLIDIARKTNGQYFEISPTTNEMNKLTQVINTIEGNFGHNRTIDITANKYIYPLVLAFILIVIDILLTVTVIKI